MQPFTKNRALQIAFPQRQTVLHPSFTSKPVPRFSPALSRPAPRYGIVSKPFLVSPGMAVPDRSAARPKHRGTARSAAQIRQREVAARVIAIDLRRPVEATGRSFIRFERQPVPSMGSFNAFRPVVRLGRHIIGWLRPSHEDSVNTLPRLIH